MKYMAYEWTEQEQNEFTGLYDMLERGPKYSEVYKNKAYDEIFKGELPYHEARSRLLGLIKEQQRESQNSGLERRIEEAETENPFKTQLSSRESWVYAGIGVLLLYILAL